jgi:hypothetical protein
MTRFLKWTTGNNVPFLLIGNLIIIVAIYAAFYQLNIFHYLPTEYNLIHWDANFYKEIKEIGYIYKPSQPSNMAFFPFFPLVWKFLGSSALLVSVVNTVLFSCSLYFLIGEERFDAIFFLAVISLPCFIFFYLPYSESIFFFFGVLLIYGYKERKDWVILIGILGCCLTRAVSTVFVPIIVVTEVLNWSQSGSKVTYKVILQCLTACLAILITVIVQGLQTGRWFVFLQAAKGFDRDLAVPRAPFTTISAGKILGTDSLAWLTGVIATYFCVKWGIALLRKIFLNVKVNPQIGEDRSVYFSALFLAAVLVIDTFFTNKINGHTNLWSINRHLLCTPFLVCFINWFYRGYKASTLDCYCIISLVIIALYLTGVFKYPNHICFYLLASAAFFISKFLAKAKLLLYPLYVVNLFLFVIYYHDFLQFKWVG